MTYTQLDAVQVCGTYRDRRRHTGEYKSAAAAAAWTTVMIHSQRPPSTVQFGEPLLRVCTALCLSIRDVHLTAWTHLQCWSHYPPDTRRSDTCV